MKKLNITLFLLCSCMLNSYAQNSFVYNSIQAAKHAGEPFNTISVLRPVQQSDLQIKEMQEHFFNPKEVYLMQYDKTAAENLHTSITMLIPLNDSNIALELLEVVMDYQIRTSDDKQILMSDKNIRHYHGIVKDDPHSIVAITFGEEEIIGLVATDEGNFNLTIAPQLGEHIFYNDKNLKQKPEFSCATEEHDDYSRTGYSKDSISGVSLFNKKVVRLYFETTYDILQTRGSIAAVEIFIAGIYNQAALLYKNENIAVELSGIMIWTTQYPFATFVGMHDLFSQYQAYRTSFNGDLGQLVTFRSTGSFFK